MKKITATSLLTIYLLFSVAAITHHHNISLSGTQEIYNAENLHTVNLELCMPLHTHILTECFIQDKTFIDIQSFTVEAYLDNYSSTYTSNLYYLKNRRGPPNIV